MKSKKNVLDYEEIFLLDQEEKPEQILSHLKSLFKKMKEEYIGSFDFSHFSIGDNSHYAKEILFSHELKGGLLLFEALSFQKTGPTGLHTHPEFVVNEIIEGKLKEDVYEVVDDKSYAFKREIVRGEGEMCAVACCVGYPHNVRALTDFCHTFSLSYGKDCVEMVKEENLIVCKKGINH